MKSRYRAITMALALVAGPALAQTASPPTAAEREAIYAAPETAYEAVRPMIRDMQRIATPTGIETTETVRLGGIDQWISIRGADRANPILIYVHGGPGAIEMGRSWVWRRGVEEYFTVVQWDQRGAGLTARENGVEVGRSTLTRDRMSDDLVELIDHLRARFGQDRVVLLGHSWGNVVGLDAAMKRPETVAAYIALSPLLAWEPNETLAYQRLVEIARSRGDSEGLAALEALAPYPGDQPATPDRLAAQRAWVQRYGGLAAYRDNAEFFLKAARLSPDYDLEDRQAIDAGGEASIQTLLPTLQAADLRSVTDMPFPVVAMVGAHDLTTPPQVTQAWMEALDAPFKQTVVFENSAHLAPHEEPGRFLVTLVETVLPLVRPAP